MKELTLEITDRCRLRCIQCSTEAGEHGDIFLSIAEVEEYLDMFHDFERVRLSGGEPFEHPQIVDITKLAKHQGREVYILTCGDLASGVISMKKFKQIRPYVDKVIFSVHGDWNTHDYIVTSGQNDVCNPVYWGSVVDSAKNACEAGIDIGFHTVAMQANYGSLDQVARMVGALSSIHGIPMDWHVLRFVKQGRGALHADQALTPEQTGQIPTLLVDLEARIDGDRLPISHWGADVEFTCTNSFYIGTPQAKCDCGTAKAVVTCYGDIIPCSALKGSNLKGMFACRNRL